MKRIFIMLLITCSAIATYAQQNDKSLAQPTHVIELLNGIIIDFGQTSDQIYSVQKNPNTNQLESSIRIVKFLAENKEWFSEDIGDCFIKDEPVSYQMQHFSPGNKEMFGINVKNINGGQHNYYMVRTSTQQEMWLMCVKNTENPQLRDAYAIVWEKAEDLKVKGTVFMITSIRPDIYTQNYEGNTEMSTVTNVINPNAMMYQKTARESMNDNWMVDPRAMMYQQNDKALEWLRNLSPEQLFQVTEMNSNLKANIVKIVPIYQTLDKFIKDGPAFKARLGIYADKYAQQIIELNKGIDEFYQEFLKKFKDLQPPTEVMNQVNSASYKEMLQYLTEQNKLFNEIYRVRGSLPKKAQKAQKHVNELTEKYMKELNKLVMERN
ncbi:MAG: hypothetical protein J6T43_12160 [Prevotella sp.]|nr:hypothetical protein [Prevotella sp.]